MLEPNPKPNSLPSDFVFGFASASFQIEGGTKEGGRGSSVWDDLCKIPGKIADGSNGDEAIDSYHLYHEDVALLKQFGANAYRFSIAWPRIIPLGGRDDPVNEEGVKYYSDLIDLCLENGITPYVTIFHWDLPSALQQKYGGWTNRSEVSKDFARYSEVLFERFGDRVKNWITLNEPSIVCQFSALGLNPTWKPDDLWSTSGSLVYAHALAVDIYRKKYQTKQGGRIGVTLNIDWCEPADESERAQKAARRAMDYSAGLYAGPIYLGKYPEELVADCPGKIPEFNEEEWALIRGSSDFFGLNSYTTRLYDGEGLENPYLPPVGKQHYKDGTPIGLRGECDWLYTVPWGFRKLLSYLHEKYSGPLGLDIIITENGFCVNGEQHMSIADVVNDIPRQEYFAAYLKEGVEDAIASGISIKGYFAWCLADNMEWMSGYVPRFGATHVDRKNGFKRTPKDSSAFLKRWFEVAIDDTHK